MRLIRGLANLREMRRGVAVTIGTYDGMHLGHQALLERLRAHGAQRACPTVMVTFEPMPREYMAPQDPPPRLTSWRERWRLLSRTGLDYVWLLRFGENVRNMPGQEFARLLARDLGASVVVVGHDFRFGRNGEATAPMLAEAGARLGFVVDVVPPVMVDGVRVSSSRIREALARGDLRQAQTRLSDGEFAPGATPHAARGYLRGARARGGRGRAARCGQSRNSADGRWRDTAARGSRL